MKHEQVIDWEKIYQRLETVKTSIEQDAEAASQKTQDILRTRARLLAQEPTTELDEEIHVEVVEFLLGGERYAIETSYIREVYPLKGLTPVPCTPPFVLGIINVRGQILSVIDLKDFFTLAKQELTDVNKVIILHSHSMEFGILADAILGVHSLPLSSIQPSLPTLTDVRGEYLKGVTAERLIILDAVRILADKHIIVHEEVNV